MRKMKDSGVAWIGEIPEDWSLLRLKDDYKNIKEIAGEDAGNYERLALTLNGVIKRAKDDSEGLQPKEFNGYQILREGDFIFKMIDLQNISTSRVGLSPFTGLVSPAYIRFAPKREGTNSKFAYYYLMSMYYNCVFNNLGGDGVRSALNASDMGTLLIPNPRQSVKATIVAQIENMVKRIASLVSNQEAQIEKLKAYKQSLITEVVTKGLDPNVPMKDSGVEWIGEIPSEWEIKPLKTMFEFGKGLPITKADLTTDGVQVVSYGQIHSKQNVGTYLHKSLVRYVNEEYLRTNEASLGKQGDLFFADTSEDYDGIGNAVYLDTDVPTFAGYHTIIAHPYDMRYSKYFAYLFLTDSWRRQLRCMASGIKVFSVTQTMLRRVSVLLPDEKECEAITSYLDSKCNAVDSLIAIKQAKIEKLNEYKKTLIYEYVTGKREA